MRDGLLEEIKSKGYWRINFRPLAAVEAPLSLRNCNEIAEKSRVSLRGWDYPHFASRNDADTGRGPAENYYEHWIKWESHVEFWRMYQSSQFLHYRALWEDWENWQDAKRTPPKGGVSVLGIIYLWTEIFEFAFRLHRNGLYADGVRIGISLENARGRQLWISEWNRAPFSYERVTQAETVASSTDLSPEKLATSDHSQYLPQLIEFFEHFDWTPGSEMLSTDQKRLLTRNFY